MTKLWERTSFATGCSAFVLLLCGIFVVIIARMTHGNLAHLAAAWGTLVLMAGAVAGLVSIVTGIAGGWSDESE